MKKTILEAVFQNVQKLSDKNALHSRYDNFKDNKSYTWTEFESSVKKLASALIDLNVSEGENIAIYSQNMPEWTIADLSIMALNAVTVPIYATNTAEQADYIIREAEIKVIFVGEQEQYNKILELKEKENSKIVKIIVFDDHTKLKDKNSILLSDLIFEGKDNTGETEKRISNIRSEDNATIIYTSGTTGEPKGVVLTHGNLLQAFKIHDSRLDNDHTDHSLAFLPLSHVFERMWTFYALYKGMSVTYLSNPKDVVPTLEEVKPTVMCSVPRLYQKVHQTIITKIEEGSKIKKKIFYWSIKIGKKQNNAIRQNKSIAFGQNIKYKIADKLVLKTIRNIFGGRMRLMPCAGAPLSAEITEFLHAANLPIVIGYGLTETTATVTVFPKKNFTYGSVGVSLPEVEVKIGENDEIMTRGKTMMKEYYKKPKETDEVFEGEWFKTGDAGYIDKEGNVVITDRIKDLMKTSGGKYIAPQMIEGMITNDQFIEQAVVIADDKPFATALLVPNFEALKKYAHSLNLKFSNCNELINLSKVKEFYEQKLEQIQKNLSNYEKVKKFKLLDKEFTSELNELTPTLKIKRKVIIQKFLDLIEDMY